MERARRCINGGMDFRKFGFDEAMGLRKNPSLHQNQLGYFLIKRFGGSVQRVIAGKVVLATEAMETGVLIALGGELLLELMILQR